MLKILFIAVIYEYSMSCMAHELQVCNFSPATPNLVLNIDDHSDHIGMVLSGYRRSVTILRDKFYRKSNG